MQRKFFIRRFWKYFLLLIIPTFLVFVISFVVVNEQLNRNLDARAQNTLFNVNNNLEAVISRVVMQNDQLNNNPYMVLSLRKLLQRDSNIAYSDAIYQRTIRATLNSILQSFPYIQSVYLYLDGYDRYFSSESGVMELEIEDGWREDYAAMGPEEENMITSRQIVSGGRAQSVMTIYQRMLLLNGVVVMNIDEAGYRELLDNILLSDDETILYFDSNGEQIFSWNADGLDGAFDLALFRQMGYPENTWAQVGSSRYLVHTAWNEQYNVSLVSLISRQAKIDSLIQMLSLFGIIFFFNAIAMLLLAYYTTKRIFNQFHYMIQVFRDAENGIYPTQPRQEMRDEYDVIMNNIIYLFLRDIKLNNDLILRKHDQEVAELTALQLQINPHFLFNTLQTVQLEVQKNTDTSSGAVQMLENLADILKYALADALETISLREEIQYLKKYVSIQKTRFGDRFILYYEVDEELLEAQVFRLMLQPLVENSILHGVRHKEGRGYIKLQIFKRQGQVHFRVIDNGIGMSGEERENLRNAISRSNVHHIGLANVNSRLILMFGEGAGLQIHSKKGMGCVMEFCLPENVLLKEE